MKHIFYIFSVLCFAASAGAATLQDCTNKFAVNLTNALRNSAVNPNSTTFTDDVNKVLQPALNTTIANDADCQAVYRELLKYKGAEFSVEFPPHIFNITLQLDGANSNINTPDKLIAIQKPDELESLLPWFGILVVKKGSLDKYANADVPIISSEFMKRNRSTFYPDNSDKPLGMWRGCTHSNHMAADNDVVNRAAHLTMNEEDSFFTGNDYYVYDGQDVYWGTAQLIGEVALALVTLGGSAAASGTAAAGQSISAASKMVTGVRLTKDASKIDKAVKAAKAAQAGSSVAAKASRVDAIKALADAGVTVKAGTRASQLKNIGNVVETAAKGIKPIAWTSAFTKPWRLIKPGISSLKPKNIQALYGPGVSWGQRLKRASLTVGGTALGVELIKAFGYSSAAVNNYADGVSFNSFGLLSADDLEGRENVVSHGAWLQIEEGGAVNEDDPLNEALAFAEAFTEDMIKINSEDPQCDVDIYVVQPGISNKDKLGVREIYYVIQNPGGSLRVSK